MCPHLDYKNNNNRGLSTFSGATAFASEEDASYPEDHSLESTLD